MPQPIVGPITCEHCGEVFLSASPYFFHKKMVHDPIPDEQLCEMECGRPAVAKSTHNKHTYFCSEVLTDCPNYQPPVPVDLPPRDF